MKMDIFHHGAVDGVTGSCHELRLTSGPGILIDCGLFQGAETSGKGTEHDALAIDFPIEHISALVVTHVHIDHVGRIPSLLGAGFQGPIYCSEPSAVLLPLVLEDAVKVGFTRNKRLIKRVIVALKKQLVAVPYGKWHTIPLKGSVNESLAIRLSPAGHILGSAYVTCRVREQGVQQQVLFSGDLGAPFAPLLPAPKSPWGCDRLVIESTYGDRLHEGRRERRERLRKLLEKALSDGGVVLIPAFSIGRTQELLYELESIIHQYRERQIARPGKTKRQYRWEDIEIVVDSPLAARFTEAYRQLKPYWDVEALKRVSRGRHPLSFDNLTTIDSHQAHKATVGYLQKHVRPTVVIAASGMCSGGRIVNYLKALLGDPRCDVVFVGYQARGTAGHDIQRWGPSGGYVSLDGESYPIRAGVHSLGGYSAHADRDNLINFVRRMRKKPGEIRIVHGDEDAKAALRTRLVEVAPGANVIIP
jgi:metallo-beta-lactamase family protein